MLIDEELTLKKLEVFLAFMTAVNYLEWRKAPAA